MADLGVHGGVGRGAGGPGVAGGVFGGGVLVQSVFTIPKFVSWNETLPSLCGASGVPASLVVHASTKLLPVWLLTVTFSFVGVVL